MKKNLLAGLNARQVDAVLAGTPAALVVAGAGCGKTGVLTRRIAWLIQERGVEPENILALTFTRKAAQEMRHRLATLLSEREARAIWLGTFHSISLRLLERHGSRLGYQRHITVYDEVDQADILQAVIDEFHLKIELQEALRQVNLYASDCIANSFTRQVEPLMREYRARLKEYNAVDFTLLLTETLRLLRDHEDVQAQYQRQFQHVLVDEYQDVDRTQYYLHEQLHPKNIFVVGDHDQSIYGFRGSDVQIVLDFAKSHEQAEVFPLEQSYRCSGNILAAANRLIEHNQRRIPKNLFTANDAGAQVQVAHLADEESEAMCIAQFIINTMAATSDRGDQFAIITRTHGQHPILAAALDTAAIPYKVIGAEMKWWRGTVPRIILAALAYLNNPRDSWRFLRAARGLLYRLTEQQYLEADVMALRQGVRVSEWIVNQHGGPIGALRVWYNENREQPVYKVVQQMNEMLDLEGALLSRGLVSKAAYVGELMEHLRRWANAQDGGVDTASFLAWTAEQDTQEEVQEDGAVKIATIHAVKGLEFNHVVVAGAAEGILPHKRSTKNIDELEEERRLCYVAATRPRHTLVFTMATTRQTRGGDKHFEQSRFINEATNGGEDGKRDNAH